MNFNRNSSPDAHDPSPGEQPRAQGAIQSWLSRYRWVPYALPLLVYMFSAQLEPNPTTDTRDTSASVEPGGNQSDPFADDPPDTPPADRFSPAKPGLSYPLVYALRIALTIIAMSLVWPAYRQFPWRVSGLSLAVGAFGAVVWIGLATLQRDALPLPAAAAQWLGGVRAGYDPLTSFREQPLALAGFLAVRFLGLALIVPIIEEFFLRGFLMRFVMQADWWNVTIGSVSTAAIVAMLAYALLTHPSEMLAALAWFSLVTWLVARTKNVWDAVAAHAVTNLLLGVWVLWSRQWWLW
jgi:CAAX prenyl protease-like protein